MPFSSASTRPRRGSRGWPRKHRPRSSPSTWPATRERALAGQWLRDFEGAGLDGVVAKALDAAYQSGKRAVLNKHVRSADCVVASFRWHKSTTEGGPEAVG